MRKALTTFLHNWSPWHLRKRVAELHHDFDHLMEVRTDFLDSCRQLVLNENEELKKENKMLKMKITQLIDDKWVMRRAINSEIKNLQDLLSSVYLRNTEIPPENTGDPS